LAFAARAAEPAPSAKLGKPSAAATRDLQLTVQARRILAQDAQLGPLNLGVNVQDGVATLWGLVPSAKLASRAIDQLKTMSSLEQVRSELSIEPLPDLIAGRLTPLPPAHFGPGENPTVGHKPSGELMPRTPDHVPLPVSPSSQPRSEWPLGAGVSLLPPVAGERAATPPPQKTSAKLLPPQAEPSLTKTVDRLRRADDRYKHIDVRIDGGVVTLGGAAYRQADLDDLALAVSQLPGVERVVVEKARTAPNLWNDAELRDLRIGSGK
jgi:osmotically-inducible protein OsmY